MAKVTKREKKIEKVVSKKGREHLSIVRFSDGHHIVTNSKTMKAYLDQQTVSHLKMEGVLITDVTIQNLPSWLGITGYTLTECAPTSEELN